VSGAARRAWRGKTEVSTVSIAAPAAPAAPGPLVARAMLVALVRRRFRFARAFCAIVSLRHR
jgi:hypothetical protein